jgi:hypothetical protein
VQPQEYDEPSNRRRLSSSDLSSSSSSSSSSAEYFDLDVGSLNHNQASRQGSGASLRNQIEFYENNQPDLVLALIRVFDRDTLSNYKFVIETLTANTYQEETSMFEMRVADKCTREFELIALNSFNSELIQNYKLRISLYDLSDELYRDGSLSNANVQERVASAGAEAEVNNFCATLTQRVKILDVNDNKPEFARKYYEFSVRENEFNLTLNSFTQIEVYDLDSSELNSRLTFKVQDKNVQSNASDHFQVTDFNSNYPVLLIVTRPFDYESVGGQFEFYLNAYDSGEDFFFFCAKLE